MARLPVPGGDKNSWGDVLNEFLKEAHNSDGSLRDGSVTAAKLASDIQASLGGTFSKQWSVSGPVMVAAGDVDYIPATWIDVPTGYTAQILTVRATVTSGTNVSLRLNRNGSPFPGLTSIGVTPVSGPVTGLGLVITDGDVIAPVVLSTSGNPQNLTVMVTYKLTKA